MSPEPRVANGPGTRGAPRGTALDVALLPATTGLLLATSFAPASLLVAPFVALTPLAVAVERAGRDARSAARRGLLAGIVAWGVLLTWVPTALAPVTRLGPAMYVAGVLVLAAFTALFAWTTSHLLHRGALPLWLAVPVAWTVAEWLRAHLGPLSFPWLELGVSLADRPALAAPAELVGGRGLGFWLALVAGITAEALAAPSRRRRRMLVAATLATLMPAAWGYVRVQGLEQTPVAQVAVVQPDLSRTVRAGPAAVDSALVRLALLSSRIPPGTVDLVVWPEAVLPTDPTTDPALADRLSDLVDRIGSSVLLGVYLRDAEGVTYNGAVLWEPERGDTGYRYRKRRLVPGVEAVPFLDPARLGGSAGFRSFGRGRDVGVHRLDAGPSFAPLICYEAIFASDARGGVSRGADFLVNITNDSWFGGDDGRQPTAALRHHPAHLVIRAVELRTGAVRAANSGISLFLEPSGRPYEATPVFSPEVRIAAVYRTEGRTLFSRVGDVAGWGSVLAALLALLCNGARRPRSIG
jgi:apolipoprotein N-acyltransferase